MSISIGKDEDCYLVDSLVGDMFKKLIANDEEYMTMFGVGVSGLNLLNEAAYLVNRYGFIRASHFSPGVLRLPYSGNLLSAEQARELLGKFIVQYGDQDLYRFYLYPASSVKYPRFGIGQYQYSDLDSTL